MKPSLSMLYLAGLVAVLGATAASAQYRGEEIVGKIERVDGNSVVVRRDGGTEVRITVTPQTEVHFQDSGDRRMFPNPSSRDLRAGMGVRFVYNDGNPTRVVVHFVPSSTEPGADVAAAGSAQVKARILSINRAGQEIRADVAGSPRTYVVESTTDARNARRGQLVVLTLADRNGTQVVTRIDPADAVGTVVRVDSGRRSVAIETDGREETFGVDNRDLLDDIRSGQRVRYEVEERAGGRRVVVALRRE